jgi:hypothetical protein
MKLLIFELSPAFRHFLPLRFKYYPQHPVFIRALPSEWDVHFHFCTEYVHVPTTYCITRYICCRKLRSPALFRICLFGFPFRWAQANVRTEIILSRQKCTRRQVSLFHALREQFVPASRVPDFSTVSSPRSLTAHASPSAGHKFNGQKRGPHDKTRRVHNVFVIEKCPVVRSSILYTHTAPANLTMSWMKMFRTIPGSLNHITPTVAAG